MALTVAVLWKSTYSDRKFPFCAFCCFRFYLFWVFLTYFCDIMKNICEDFFMFQKLLLANKWNLIVALMYLPFGHDCRAFQDKSISVRNCSMVNGDQQFQQIF